VWRISFLALLPGEDKTTWMQALADRLHDLGYREGQTMTFTYRSAEGRPERLPQLARELVQAQPDVLMAAAGAAVVARSAAQLADTVASITATGGRAGQDLITANLSPVLPRRAL
jgi:ABC-type uncharacterized transport system substrate-binding protein